MGPDVADAQQSAHSVTSPISADLPHEALFRLLSEVGLNFDEYHLFVERLGRQPNKVELYTARAGDTWQAIAQCPGKGFVKASTLAIMNDHAVADQPSVGERIKIVVAGS